MTKEEASLLWAWLERIREYLMGQNKWREIDEKRWKELSLHLLRIANGENVCENCKFYSITYENNNWCNKYERRIEKKRIKPIWCKFRRVNNKK